MARRFKTVDYERSGQQTLTIDECVPADHLARFVVAIIALLDLSAIEAQYAPVGGEAYAPAMLLALLLYGYATGTFSSRRIEKATYEVIPMRFLAGGWHPDHSTIAQFRKDFLAEIQELFVQVLVVAHELGYLHLGRISLDGSKIHADASKSKAVSYGYLPKLEQRLQTEVAALLALGEQADQHDRPAGLDIEAELAFRQERLLNLAQARAVLEARAQERDEAEQAAYEAKVREREEKAQRTGRKPGGRAPQPPEPGPRDKDQYNFTDPDSRIMKNSTNGGFDQHYNVQAAVDQDSLFIARKVPDVVAHTLSNHPVDTAEALPTVDAIPAALGRPPAAALDHGYFSPTNIQGLESRGIDPYIATGREPHQRNWTEFFAASPEPPAADASPIVKMAYKLRTDIGKAIYRLRKCTVEPVIGIIKEVLGFRQFSLRGLVAAAGEWGLVCLAWNLKRLHTLMGA
ncbi:MAG: transposase [Chloroflexi bacterium]|nr:transposase [Chloroflexota bacterium]MBU1750005.1 transposase [Chloroflexota bacterium]